MLNKKWQRQAGSSYLKFLLINIKTAKSVYSGSLLQGTLLLEPVEYELPVCKHVHVICVWLKTLESEASLAHTMYKELRR